MLTRSLSLLALIALAAPAFAQDTTEAPAQDPAAEAPAEAEAGTAETGAEAAPEAGAEAGAEAAPEAGAEAPAGSGAEDLNMGAPAEGAAAEPQVGEPYIREEFGDWGLRCLRAEEGPDPCQLYQLLLDAQGNAVAEISMFPLPEGGEAAAGATIVAPLDTRLPAELTLSVDGGAARRYPFSFCNRAGCVARLGFTAEDVAQFRRGNAALLRIVPAAAPDEVVDLTISLTGFTAGYDSSEAQPDPTP